MSTDHVKKFSDAVAQAMGGHITESSKEADVDSDILAKEVDTVVGEFARRSIGHGVHACGLYFTVKPGSVADFISQNADEIGAHETGSLENGINGALVWVDDKERRIRMPAIILDADAPSLAA